MNRVAVSLAPSTTADALRRLRRLAGLVGLAELRLDAMSSADLARLAATSPVPLIAT